MMLTDEQRILSEIFFPGQLSRIARVERGELRFVHYTSAAVAMSIILEKEVWLRNASVMNDFSEVEYGLGLLLQAYASPSGRSLKSLIDDKFSGISAQLERAFNSWLNHFKTETYITCLSEHSLEEDDTGRLSMWRAYGGNTGVALVLNGRPFATSDATLGAYSSPVSYLSDTEFQSKFDTLVGLIEKGANHWAVLSSDVLLKFIFTAFRFAIVCTKHPGFHEEKEWRVIYAPTLQPSSIIRKGVKSIDGSPQVYYRLPLIHAPEQGLYNADIPSLLERIIIGPNRFPGATWAAFVNILEEAGVEGAIDKVWTSRIPLRR